jgi:enoyl-CoA hydratase/carnithine racemase
MSITYETILVEIEEEIGVITLNRPEKRNALSIKMLQELTLAAHWFDQQTAIKVVLIRGNGTAFSAGADLMDAMNRNDADKSWVERRELGQVGYKMTQAIQNMRAITVAEVQGYAIGGAFLLMLACDFKVVAEKTYFSIPEIDLGIPLTWGGIPKLVSEIGPSKTKDLVITCRKFGALEAKSLGLVNYIVSPKTLSAHSFGLAQTLNEKPSMPMLITKEQVNAVSKNIGSAYVASAEGDMLQNAQKDPESLKAAMSYLKYKGLG